jgi:CheY-like chemotaxis protein
MSTPTRTRSYPGVPQDTAALVVEDDYGSALAMKALLENRSVTVLEAESGRIALETLDSADGRSIKIVLMDIMSGHEGITAIRERPGLAELPITAVTAKNADGERERRIAARATDFVPKPIDSSTLLTAIAASLREQQI